MSNVLFSVPKLTDNGAWLDYRNQYPGGFGWRYDRPLTAIRLAANHHSVTNPTGNAKADVDQLWNIHRGNGWGGIGYNFVITSDVVKGKDGLDYAKVAYVGDLGSVRAHTPNVKGAFGLRKGFGNEDIVAACMIGQLHINQPTDAQIRSAYWLYRELIQEEPQRLPNLRGDLPNKLHSHKDFDATACPGDWGSQKHRIVYYQDPPKVEKKEEIRVATIPFTEKTVKADDIPLGEVRVIQEGADGEKQVVWEVTYTNGQETSRKIVGERVVKAPVEKITAEGTYVAPEPPVEPEPPVTPPEKPSGFWELLKALIDWIIERLRK